REERGTMKEDRNYDNTSRAGTGGTAEAAFPGRRQVILTSALTLMPLLAGLLLWSRLPDRVATHFNIAGEADGWSGKPFAVFGLPLFLLAVHLLCLWAVSMDPRKQNVGRKLFSITMWICPAVALFVGAMVYGNALGLPVDNSRMGMFFLGFVFIVVGNYLPKCRQNYTVGIKLPWTLADEDNWNRTHRMAGPLWIAAGAVVLLCSLLGAVSLWTTLVPTLAAALIPCAYSAALYRRG
ncbi:MAG: SdpI family protein, partial [Oscillibacter sp.]|nr:SdpI family protein [Oscillibacter sp.]